MKGFYIVLSLWVISLSTIPCCADDDGDDSVNSEQTTSESGKEDCGNCSPFLLCGSCNGFTFVIHSYRFLAPMKEEPKIITPFTIVQLRNSLAEVWQPPKLA